MATFQNQSADRVLTIRKFLGVNENPDGDVNLRVGEASAMTNCRPTKDGSLRKRSGTQNVANMLNDYSIDVGDGVVVHTEITTPSLSLTFYPGIDITEGGILYVTGTPVTVTASNAFEYEGYYWQSEARTNYTAPRRRLLALPSE